jgi:prepilin-type N-terminal cleavage/methylation domain-containing protein
MRVAMHGRYRVLPVLRNSRGDTIVEVLIAIAIVSLVLTSAYALTNKNVSSIQQVQEQGYAQKLAEQQVELLRAAATKPTATGCFDPATGAFVSPVSNATCNPVSGGATYGITITNDPAGSEGYTVVTSWDALGGGRPKVTIYYKVAS